jgi:hypothetical protein
MIFDTPCMQGVFFCIYICLQPAPDSFFKQFNLYLPAINFSTDIANYE